MASSVLYSRAQLRDTARMDAANLQSVQSYYTPVGWKASKQPSVEPSTVCSTNRPGGRRMEYIHTSHLSIPPKIHSLTRSLTD